MRTTQKESFAQLADITGKPRRIAGNTWIYTRASDGAQVTRLHSTDICATLPDGRYWLNTSGWRSPLTKGRIDDFLRPHGFRVYSDKGVWMVSDGTVRVPFVDGMYLPDMLHVDGEGLIKAQRRKLAAINAYCKRIRHPLPQPSPGDCWVCSMFHAEKPAGEFKTMGVARDSRQSGPGKPDCLQSHLDEGYVHGSLIINAMRWAGYSDQGIGFYFRAGDLRIIRSAVRRYLKRKLGLG